MAVQKLTENLKNSDFAKIEQNKEDDKGETFHSVSRL